MICSSVCLLRFIVWSFLKARLQFTLDHFNGATSTPRHTQQDNASLYLLRAQKQLSQTAHPLRQRCRELLPMVDNFPSTAETKTCRRSQEPLRRDFISHTKLHCDHPFV
jgi:hypothetical protein